MSEFTAEDKVTTLLMWGAFQEDKETELPFPLWVKSNGKPKTVKDKFEQFWSEIYKLDTRKEGWNRYKEIFGEEE